MTKPAMRVGKDHYPKLLQYIILNIHYEASKKTGQDNQDTETKQSKQQKSPVRATRCQI